MDLAKRVVVITGAGNGLGRAYALAFAKYGAKVVVNDFSPQSSENPADKVVEEIAKMGGTAVADYNNALDGEKIINTAISKFGRIDVLVNNAGILRDSSFAKMTESAWDSVLEVHVKGAFSCTKAAWKYMQDRKYGRIINITSASGLYGNFGQANYSTAKMAVVGLCRTLAQEGSKYGIHINCVAPLASTKMTEKLLPEALLKGLKPEHVAPVVLYLSSPKCQDTGKIYEVGAGWVAAVRLQRSPGAYIPVPFDASQVESNWEKINTFVEGKCEIPQSLQDSIVAVSKSVVSDSGEQAAQNTTGELATPSGKSERIFKIIKAYVESDPDNTAALISKIKSLFQFDITENAKLQHQWVLDFKSSPGSVYQGQVQSPDAVFTLDSSTFVDICLRKVNPQVAFLLGKMKIRGSMSKATKFTPDIFPKIVEKTLECDASMHEFIKTFAKKSGASNIEEPGKSSQELSELAKKLKSSTLYPLLKEHLLSPAGVALVKRVNCVYRLNITSPSTDTPCTFFINLKVTPPTIAEVPFSTKDRYDCCFTMDDEVFYKIATGKMNPQLAFMQGKMKIKGSTQAAMKFSKDMFPKISKL